MAPRDFRLWSVVGDRLTQSPRARCGSGGYLALWYVGKVGDGLERFGRDPRQHVGTNAASVRAMVRSVACIIALGLISDVL